MAFNEFLAEVKSAGLAKNNRFVVSIDGGDFIGSDVQGYRKMLLFCDSVQLPGQSLATVPNRTFGELRETPYDRLFDTVTMTFYVDRSMAVKYYFDNWMNQIQNPSTRKFSYYKDYTHNLTVDVLDTQNETNYRVTMFECYPKAVSSIQLDAANKDVMKLNVTMQYRNWTSQPLEVYYRGRGEPLSPSILESYNSDFYGFQSAYNNFMQPVSESVRNITSMTGGIPGFDGSIPDTQGFITTASDALTRFTRGGIGGALPALSDIMNLRF